MELDDRAAGLLRALELPDHDGADGDSPARFDDGGQWRIEIPSTEGPAALRAVFDEADRLGVPVHRVSQGSGVMLQTEDEIREIVDLGTERHTEVCLFVGPRAAWDIGAQVRSTGGAVVAGAQRGADQLRYAVEDAVHACDHGVRSLLVADLGLLATLHRLKVGGHLPEDLILKVSVQLPVANPATAVVLTDLGATTLNLPPDLTTEQIAAIRRVTTLPIDMYIEAPDDHGGSVRYYDIPEIVRVAAPVYLKFTVRNSPGLYPAGKHMEGLVTSLAAERVRRAKIGIDLLNRMAPDNVMSPWGGSEVGS